MTNQRILETVGQMVAGLVCFLLVVLLTRWIRGKYSADKSTQPLELRYVIARFLMVFAFFVILNSAACFYCILLDCFSVTQTWWLPAALLGLGGLILAIATIFEYVS